jgi:hypothetical protein
MAEIAFLCLPVAVACLFVALLAPKCVHAWEEVSCRDFPSRLEMLKSSGMEFKAPVGLAAEWLQRRYVSVLRCGKCGLLETRRFDSV